MTYEQFKQNISYAGLKNKDYAQLLHKNSNSINNYSKKGVPIHAAIISEMVAYCAAQGIDPIPIMKKATKDFTKK